MSVHDAGMIWPLCISTSYQTEDGVQGEVIASGISMLDMANLLRCLNKSTSQSVNK